MDKFPDCHHVRPRSRGLLRDDDDDEEGAAVRQRGALLSVPPAIHSRGLHTGAATGLHARELRGSLASLGAPLAVNFHHGDDVYTGAPYRRYLSARFLATHLSWRAPADQFHDGDGNYVRPRSRGLLRDDDDDDEEGDAIHQSGALLNVPPSIHGRGLHTGAATGLHAGELRGSLASLGAPLAVNFDHGDDFYTGAPYRRYLSAQFFATHRSRRASMDQSDDGHHVRPQCRALLPYDEDDGAYLAATGASRAGRILYLVQHRRGDGGVILIRTGRLGWEVRCVRSADDGDDAMPSTSADAITSGTAGSCTMSACLMCLEAQHRLAFERRHGSDTFPYSIPAETATDLLKVCKSSRVWNRKDGADEDEVLEEIQQNGGADAWPDQEGWERRCKLQIKSWDTFNLKPLPSASSLARMIRTEGPLIGCLDVVLSDYYAAGWEKRVYGGGSGKKKAESHALVCMEYRFDGEDIRVVDNHEWDGPVRWISKTAFTSFTQIKVEPLDASALGREVSWWRRLVRRLWREETFWWLQRRRLSMVWNKKKST